MGTTRPQVTSWGWAWWAAAAVLAAVGQPALWWHSSEAALGVSPPGAIAAVLAVAVAAPLGAGRRHPLVALSASTAALLAYGSLSAPPSPVSLATLVLVAWVVACLGGWRAAVAASAVALALAVSPWANGSRSALLGSAGDVLTVSLAAIVGLVMRAYRSRAELERREERLVTDRRLFEAQRAAVAERFRIARELHDSVGHAVTLSALKVEAAALLIGPDPAGAEALLHEVSQGSRDAMAELHRLVALVRDPDEAAEPVGAPAADLGTGLSVIAERFSGPGLVIDMDLHGDQALLPPEHESALAAIVAEALCNVARHASAAHATVRLAVDGGEVRLEVRDDGRGPAPGARGGFGLSGAAERARSLGGGLELRAGPSGGAVLSASLPLPGGKS
ncbi:MAG: sensor histidine kinase [Acidimicrobiales bacterium]